MLPFSILAHSYGATAFIPCCAAAQACRCSSSSLLLMCMKLPLPGLSCSGPWISIIFVRGSSLWMLATLVCNSSGFLHGVLGAVAVVLWNPKRAMRTALCLPPTWTAHELGKRTSIERFAGPGVPLFPPGALLLSPGGLPSQCRSL